MAVTIASFRITGLSPLLMNNPASMARTSSGLAKKKHPEPAEEAESKLYRKDDGSLFLNTMAFRSAILGACSGRRIGKVAARGVIAGAVFNPTTQTTLVHPTTGKPISTWKVNIVRAVVQRMGVLRARPEIPEWACDLDFEVDAEFVPDTSLVLELLNIAGKIKGVGDWRPEKMGPYGRFRAEAASARKK